jgi:hypothetical protein
MPQLNRQEQRKEVQFVHFRKLWHVCSCDHSSESSTYILKYSTEQLDKISYLYIEQYSAAATIAEISMLNLRDAFDKRYNQQRTILFTILGTKTVFVLSVGKLETERLRKSSTL